MNFVFFYVYIITLRKNSYNYRKILERSYLLSQHFFVIANRIE